MKIKITNLFLLTCTLLFVSCFEDTDFNQANEVLVTPEIELDLIYFNLEASRFYDNTTNTEILVVQDTLNVDFFERIGDNNNTLKGADFLFKFTNSVTRGFTVSFDFLDGQNISKYFMQTTVPSGSEDTPVISDFVQFLDEVQIKEIRMAQKVLFTVITPTSLVSLTGELNLKSKTTYYFQLD